MKPRTKQFLILAGLLAQTGVALAAEQGAGYSEHFNPAMIISWTLVILIGLLAIVIHVLGKILITSVKHKLGLKNKSLKSLLILALFSPLAGRAQEEVAANTGLSLGFDTNFTFWYLLFGILVLELSIIIVFSILILKNLRTAKQTEKKGIFSFLASSRFWDRFNKSRDIKEEKSILLDHDYDGIKELDNDLPPWWKYGFYVSIVWSVVYLFYYHISSGPSSTEEYESEMAQAAIDVAAYKATMALNVDENTVTLMSEATDISKGKALFSKNCVACHADDGGGGIGPNLTDKYWLYGGGIQHVFKTIKYGAKNGMKAWENDLSPVEIQQVASFVLSLQGSQPANPAPPKGDLYVPADTEAADSSSVEENI